MENTIWIIFTVLFFVVDFWAWPAMKRYAAQAQQAQEVEPEPTVIESLAEWRKRKFGDGPVKAAIVLDGYRAYLDDARAA